MRRRKKWIRPWARRCTTRPRDSQPAETHIRRRMHLQAPGIRSISRAASVRHCAARQSRNQISEYLAQRRKGRKVRSLGLKFIRKGAIVLPLNLATLRLGEKSSESELFAQATQILNYSRARSRPVTFRRRIKRTGAREKTLFPNAQRSMFPAETIKRLTLRQELIPTSVPWETTILNNQSLTAAYPRQLDRKRPVTAAQHGQTALGTRVVQSLRRRKPVRDSWKIVTPLPENAIHPCFLILLANGVLVVKC
jgi:hypothetical protein